MEGEMFWLIWWVGILSTVIPLAAFVAFYFFVRHWLLEED